MAITEVNGEWSGEGEGIAEKERRNLNPRRNDEADEQSSSHICAHDLSN